MFILENCKANILVVGDENTLRNIECYKNKLPNLKKIILWGGEVPEESTDTLSFIELMRLGMEDMNDQPVLERQRNMAINQCCILVYTSGTTGNPKGILLVFILASNCTYYCNKHNSVKNRIQ